MFGGHIHLLGASLSIAGVIGARIGAVLVIKKTTHFIRPCFITMMTILCIMLFIKTNQLPY